MITRNPKPETRNPKTETRKPELESEPDCLVSNGGFVVAAVHDNVATHHLAPRFEVHNLRTNKPLRRQ